MANRIAKSAATLRVIEGKSERPEPHELAAAKWLAELTDTAIRLPFGIRIGLDFLIGLIPGIGDLIMLGVALMIVLLGYRIGAPKPLLWKMTRNALVDVVTGFVPIAGDLFDAWFKANRRNVKLLEQWWQHQA